VSRILQKVLNDSLSELAVTPAPTAELHDLDFTTDPTGPLLTIFLFEVGEDPSARNRPRVRQTVPPGLVVRKPPVALLLKYMLTAWGGSEQTQQQILGKAIQTLYDNAILSGPDFDLGGTPDLSSMSDEAFKITMSPLSLEERTRVWHAVQKPYRLSVSYEVRVVNLDSLEDRQTQLVGQRRLDMEAVERIR